LRYIGSKTNLLGEIRSLVNDRAPRSRSLCDMFAGTGVVGRSFKTSHALMSNDILYFAYVLNMAHNGLQRAPTFAAVLDELGQDPIAHLNSLGDATREPTSEDFFAQEYSPAGERRRQYLSTANALHIDRVRQTIEAWRERSLVSDPEYYYLLGSLIEAVPSVSNTTGTYGAYLKHWDGRALKDLNLKHLDIVPSDHVNQVFNEDANELIHRLSGDVLYLDTPYNGRQYSTNYHLLETLARYDRPALKGITGTRSDGSGQSAYCRKASVYDSFDHLLAHADFGTIVVSYSSDGLLSEEQLTDLLSTHGKASTLDFRKIPYRRYKRTLRSGNEVLEYLIAVNR